MKRNNFAKKDSQQGPKKSDLNYTSFIANLSFKMYPHMFIKDFCSPYSITLSKHFSERNFFKVSDNQQLFKNIFGYDFLEYDLDKLLSNVTENLILFGKAYVERIYLYDDEDKLIEIAYRCVNCKNIKHRKNHIVYKMKTDEKQKLKGRIPTERIIVFNLKDMGFSKKFFISRIKKLKKQELPKTELTFNNYFDINHFIKKNDYRLLKTMKKIHWNARKQDNTYVTEPYFVYRTIMFEKLQNQFLEYLISKINEDINSITDITKFTGKITFESITQNYDTLIVELESGEKNCEQIGNIIYKVL